VRVGGKAAFLPVAQRIAEQLLHAKIDGDDGDDSDDDSNEAAAGDDNDLELVGVPDEEEEMLAPSVSGGFFSLLGFDREKMTICSRSR
jgi:hypothetical protein